MAKYVKETVVKSNGHKFALSMAASGRIDCRIDNGELFSVKDLQDGKVRFIKPHELAIKGELVKVDCLELDEKTFTEWKEAQELIYSNKTSGVVTFADAKKEALNFVDKWDRQVRSYKGKDKVRRKMCIHTFRIGNDTYTFVEREFPEQGVVINPDYAISEELPSVGGVPKQYGELMFWDYYFENEGWKRVRVLSNNELICLTVIQKYGYFVLPHKVDPWSELKAKNKTPKKEKVAKEKKSKEKKTAEKTSEEPVAEKPKKKGFSLFKKKEK